MNCNIYLVLQFKQNVREKRGKATAIVEGEDCNDWMVVDIGKQQCLVAVLSLLQYITHHICIFKKPKKITPSISEAQTLRTRKLCLLS